MSIKERFDNMMSSHREKLHEISEMKLNAEMKLIDDYREFMNSLTESEKNEVKMLIIKELIEVSDGLMSDDTLTADKSLQSKLH